MSEIHEIRIIGNRLTLLGKAELLNEIGKMVQAKKKSLVLSGNVLSFNMAYENSWFREFLNSASFIRIDGAGLRLGARLLGYDTPSRMTWADFAWDLAAFCEKNSYSLFLLGSREGIAQKAALRLKEKYPCLQIVGVHHGYFNKQQGNPENTAVLQQIREVNPDILIIGFGMPLQEKWLMQNWQHVEAIITMTGGAVFDYISDELQRAPKWMTDNGFEWLGRLLIEPQRLWRRYVIGNPLFFWRVMKQKFGLLDIE